MHDFSGPHIIILGTLINKDIFNIIIVDVIFHLEDMDGVTLTRLLLSFVPNLYSSEDAADAGDVSRYAIIVSNTKQFQLVAQYLAAGLSFHQVEHVIIDTKEMLVLS